MIPSPWTGANPKPRFYDELGDSDDSMLAKIWSRQQLEQFRKDTSLMSTLRREGEDD